MELENKHLKSYFGTELKGIIADDGIVRELYSLFEYTLQVTPSKHGFTYCLYKHFKPLLFPLSTLTELMEDGSIPIVELAKINGFTPQDYYIELQNGTIVLYGEQFRHPEERLTARFFFELDVDNCSMDKGIEFKDNAAESIFSPLREQLKSFEYLFANHFDVYGLIDAGLAIDKRTIK